MNWFQRFMAGRNGFDMFCSFLLLISLLCSLLGRIFRFDVLIYLAAALLIYCYFRVFSRNTTKRARENAKFLAIVGPWFSRIFQRRSSYQGNYGPASSYQSKPKKEKKDKKNYVYFRCKNCKQQLRVPRHKGKIKVTCPNCKTQVIKKT